MRRVACMVTAILVAATLSVSAVSAADGTIPDQQSGLDACTPAWDPGDPRIVTWDGRTLHQQPYEVGDLFYRVWGDGDLEAGRHLRRWRWEYECVHPAPPTDGLRQRATVVVIRNGHVLLVRGGSGDFSIPGGGIEPGEQPAEAAVRELLEETGLTATRVEYLFQWASSVNRHHVFLVEADGEVRIAAEIRDFRWWDRREPLPTHAHVEPILALLEVRS